MSVTSIKSNVTQRTQLTVTNGHKPASKVASNGESNFIATTNLHLIAKLVMQAPSNSGIVSTANLIGQLRSPDFSKRREAAEALGKLGSPQVAAALQNAIATEKIWSVKASMVEALGNIGDKRASATIRKALTDKNWWVQTKAAEAAAKLNDPEAVPLLLDLLRSNNKIVNKTAGDAIHRILDPKVVDTLVSALGDPNEYVRVVASAALATQGDKRAVPALMIIAGKDPKLSVKEAAVRALGELNDPRAFATIIEVFNKKHVVTAKRGGGHGTYTYWNTTLNVAAAEVLGKMKSDKAIDALIERVKIDRTEYPHYNRDAEGTITEAVLKALGKTGNPRVKPMLMKWLFSPFRWTIGVAAADGLRQFSSDPKVKAALLKYENQQQH